MSKSFAKTFPKEVENRKNGECATCSKVVKMSDFKDDLSKTEFSISGMCQDCQDSVFGDTVEEDEEE